jgi:hypothetical protein
MDASSLWPLVAFGGIGAGVLWAVRRARRKGEEDGADGGMVFLGDSDTHEPGEEQCDGCPPSGTGSGGDSGGSDSSGGDSGGSDGGGGGD